MALLFSLITPAAAQNVFPSWPLKPAGLQVGDKFRLMFVTSTIRFAGSTNIAHYNTFVQNRAKAGHTAIRPYGGQFKAVASVSAISARDNTGTTGTGVPIYWLNGAKVADDYADFYDGTWDSYARKNEHGSNAPGHRVWTGSNNNGTKDNSGLLGTTSSRVGFGTAGRTLRGNLRIGGANSARPFFSLSPVFTVVPDDVIQMNHVKREVAEFGNHKANGGVKLSVEVAAGLSPKGHARTINYTVGGTATRGNADNPKDYYIKGCTSSTCSVKLPANSRSVLLPTIYVNDDGIDEGDETIVLTLKSGSGYTLKAPSNQSNQSNPNKTTVTIKDDDTRGLTFHRTWADVKEGSSETYTVKLASQPTAKVTVNIASNNQDVTVSPTSLTFNPSGSTKLWSRTQTVTIDATQDNDAVDDEATLTHTTSGGDYGGANALSIGRPVSVGDDETPDPITSNLPRISLTGGADITEGTAASFTVNADPAPTARLTINVEVTEPDGQDFVATGQEGVRTVTLNAGATSATFTVPTVNDNTDEPDGRVQVYVNDGTGYNAGAGSVVNVNDDDGTPPPTTPTASFAAASSSAAESAGTRNVNVNLSSAAPSGGLTLSYTVTGSATAGSGNDFTIQGSGTLSIAAGGASATIPVAINDDSAAENAETVILTLAGGAGYTVGSPSVHTLTISDNDGAGQPSASFAAASSSAAESAGTRNVTVNLSSATPSGGLSLSYSVTGSATAGSGNDFTIQGSGTVSVTAGATTANIPVVILDDSTQESAETVILTLTGGTGYTLGSTTVHTLTITDNDTPRPGTPALQFSRNTLSVSEGGTGSYTVRLATQPTATVTVAIASNNTDVTLSAPSLTFSTSNWNSPQTVTVSAAQDDDSNNDSATLTHTASGGGYNSVAAASVTVTVNDDDGGGTGPGPGPGPGTTDPETPSQPSITIRADSTSVEEGTDASFTVTASTAPAENLAVTLRVTETGGQDYVDASDEGSRTIILDAGTTSASYPVPTVDNATEEPDGQVTVTVESGTGYTVASSSASVTITDNDRHEITFASEAGRVREGRVHTITLHIDPAPSAPLTLRYRLSGTATQGEDYRIQTTTPGEIQIPAGSTRVVVRVQSLVDEEADSGKTVVLHLMGGDGLSLGAVRAHVLTLLAGAAASPEVGRGWLVRFGRTVAEQGLDSIAQRLRAPRSAGTRVSLGGTQLAGQDTRQEPGAQAFTPAPLLQHHTDLHTDLHNGVPPSTQQSLSLHEVLQGSHFLSVGEIDAYGGSLAFWGRAAHSSFDGKEDHISLDGDSTALLLGADYALGPWLGGITLSHSEGDGDYRESGTPGDIEASLTSILPWLSLQATERLQVWGALGIGEGDMHLEPEGGERLRTDIDWTLASIGIRSALLSPQGTTGLSLSLVGDVLWMETDAQEINGLSVASAGVSRARLGVEGDYAMVLADGTQLIPRLELGVREDEGDAENGAGIELGGGLAWSDPHRGLTLELAGRTLITHDSNDLEDKGVSVSLDYDPIPGSARGLSLSLHQEMGTASTGGLEALFASAPLTTPTDHTTGSDDTNKELESRLRLEAAYGLVAFEGRFIAGPQAALSHSPTVQDYSLGWRLVPSARHQDLSVQITALRREHDQEPPEHATTLEMIARW